MLGPEAWQEIHLLNTSLLSLFRIFSEFLGRVLAASLLAQKHQNGDIVFQVRLYSGEHPVRMFSSFDMTFGVFGSDDSTDSLFIDYLSWEGNADLFVHIYLPSSLLVFFMGRLGCKISFGIRYIFKRTKYTEIYGNRLIIFDTGLTHFWLCDARQREFVLQTESCHQKLDELDLKLPRLGRFTSKDFSA